MTNDALTLDAASLPPAASGTSRSALAELRANEITAWFGQHKVLDRVSLTMPAGGITALIGPSGCGKSTFLRILNRMHELVPSAALAGEVLLDGEDIYDPQKKLTDARRAIGMVFQKPNPFPKSIYENVAYSLRVRGMSNKNELDDRVESVLPGPRWPLERSEGPFGRSWRRALGWTTAATVHRPIVGHQTSRALDG